MLVTTDCIRMVWMFFKVPSIYSDCCDYVYVVKCFMSMGAPEAFVEGMLNILKLMLAGNATLDFDNVNDEYRLRSH